MVHAVNVFPCIQVMLSHTLSTGLSQSLDAVTGIKFTTRPLPSKILPIHSHVTIQGYN